MRAQKLIFLGLDFVTISLDNSYVKNQFLGPSRVVPLLGTLFCFFLLFFFLFFCCPHECGLHPLCNGFTGGWEQFDPRDGARTRGRTSERFGPSFLFFPTFFFSRFLSFLLFNFSFFSFLVFFFHFIFFRRKKFLFFFFLVFLSNIFDCWS